MPLQPHPDPKTDCLICRRKGIRFELDSMGNSASDCPRCGLWITVPARELGPKARLRDWLDDGNPQIDARRRARLSHLVRQQQKPERITHVPIDRLGEWDLNRALPSPSEQADNLLLWISDHQENYSDAVDIDSRNASEIAAWVGAPLAGGDLDLVLWLVDSVPEVFLERQLLLGGAAHASLTLAGWERVGALRTEVRDNHRAFMAMKFGDPALNSVLADCFKPAVAAAGFELATVLEGQPAGLIDDRMRVAIRTARFVISDLTHGSHGAYWEAGFAEGLGRPVIYTCRKVEWEAQSSHFDTNHLSTIVWDPANLPEAAARLTAMIRATLPAEATMD
jgi:hypothetical protein